MTQIRTHEFGASQHAPTQGQKAKHSCTLKSVSLILFHPDYTVGSGVSPDLLTFTGIAAAKRSRA
jgi:hypothetical protein